MNQSDPGHYFAAQDPVVVANEMLQRGKSFFETCETNGYLASLKKNWLCYHGLEGSVGVTDQHSIRFTGEQGELVSIFVNHFRNIAQNMLVMVTSNRPVMEAQSINTDYKSLAQTTLANGILEYYMRQKNLENNLRAATEMAIVMGAGYIKLEWNATDGEQYDFDETTGQFNYEGDINFTNLSPFDVVFDGTKECWNNDWLMTRTYKSKYSLMAQYPELAEKIRQVTTKSDRSIYKISFFSNDKTDDVPVFEFFHKRTPALPDGRYILFLENNIVLLDTKLPYRSIPVFRIVPSEILGTPYGYTPMFDIYPIQEAMNSLYSTILTNQNAFGVQNLFVPRDSDLAYSALAGGMNIMEGNAPPVPINLTSTPKEIFDYLDILIKAAETISGVNSVSRGAPEASLKSGTALALVQSMALQYMSGLQQSYIHLIEDVGTNLINILKDFAMTPKLMTIVGKNNKTFLKEFTGEDINAVSRVMVTMGNPLAACLKKDTPVLMHDGSTKVVQDITTNDQLMGPDSKPRTVLSTNTGIEQMYDIYTVSKHGRYKFLYGCNESHILTLHYCSNDGRHGLKKGQEVDMSVKEYLSMPERHRRLFMGFRTGVEFSKKNLSIPPYILGAWLGDGSSACTTLTSMDQELADEWKKYADSQNLQVKVYDHKDSKAKAYRITSGSQGGSPDRNIFHKHLRDLNLINNKHIPFDYLNSDRKDRLELLAGLIDTDGSLTDTTTFVFTQKEPVLAKKVQQLARSLGFRATNKLVPSGGHLKAKGIDSYIYKVTIGGNLWEVPTRLPRKQVQKTEKHRNWLNYGIKVIPVEEGEYYGFTLKEEPHFLLADYTVTHNSTAGRIQMVQEMTQMGLITDPKQYFDVLNTGNLDVAFEGETNQLLLIKKENERMMEGTVPIVAPTDQHQQHINEHTAVLSDPDLREEPNLVNTVMQHIQDHMNMLRNTDPQLLAMTKQQALPPLQPPPAPPGAPLPPGATPPGPMGPPPPNVTPMKHSTIPNMEQPQQGLVKAGQQIIGPGMQGRNKVPNLPKPPKPFQTNPVLAKNVLPQ